MAIAVEFPDGSVRNVPAQLRACPSGTAASALPAYEKVPLNCDSRWRFVRIGGRWLALPRMGGLSILRPAAPLWWADIAQMQDRADETGVAKPQRNPTLTAIQESAA